MKRNFFITILFFLFSIIFAENFTADGKNNEIINKQNFLLDGKYRFIVNTGLGRIDLEGNKIIYIPCIADLDTKIDNYSVKRFYGMTFLKLDKRIPKEYTEDYLYKGNKGIITDDKFLLLAGKNVGTNEILLFATTKGFDKHYPCTETSISERTQSYKDCTSELVEKDKEYSVNNLCNLAVDTPWVEAVKGDGIGEGFTLINDHNKKFTTLLIMNGYISYEKPYLYKQNNRVKKIKVTGLKSKKSQVIDILDTPHPQTVDISFISAFDDIRVEIVDVYKGTKYDDTCLHYCIAYDDIVIPYEDCISSVD